MRFLPGLFRRYPAIPAVILLLLLLYSCATIVSPSGGVKDETPPTLVSSDPRNQSANFRRDRLILGFSEYIVLKDMDKNLIISPPLNENPDFRIKSRSLIVKLKDTLRSNTTYNFYFGNAVVDLTEGNPLKNLSFAFSTGSFIDSLSIVGKVTDAFTRMPVKDALVMLYSDMADSVPMQKRPLYVSRTGEGGAFVLNNLADGKYRVIALKDGNSDYLYNLPTEQIGFNDSLIEPSYIEKASIDTSKVATPPANQLSIDLFSEPDSIQRVLKGNITAPHVLSIIFRYPARKLELHPLNLDSAQVWSVREFSPGHDTLTCWLTGSMPDTLRLKVTDNGTVIDTLDIATVAKPKTTERGKAQKADSTLRFTTNTARASALNWDVPYTVTFANPLASYNASLICLVSGEQKDTIQPEVGYADSIHRRVTIRHPWKTLEEYILLFPQGAFKDIYGQVNDSVRSVFKLRPKDEYGNFRIMVKLINVPHPMIIQLLTEKGAVVKQQIITSSQKVDFGFLSPGKYGLKAIYDLNGNGKWDTGVYLKRRQPERIAIHPKLFEVRGNWELEEEWEL